MRRQTIGVIASRLFVGLFIALGFIPSATHGQSADLDRPDVGARTLLPREPGEECAEAVFREMARTACMIAGDQANIYYRYNVVLLPYFNQRRPWVHDPDNPQTHLNLPLKFIYRGINTYQTLADSGGICPTYTCHGYRHVFSGTPAESEIAAGFSSGGEEGLAALGIDPAWVDLDAPGHRVECLSLSLDPRPSSTRGDLPARRTPALHSVCSASR